MRVYSINEIKDRLTPIFIANDIKKAVLFGSYAKGEATEKSDVDIMIDSGGTLRGLDFFGVFEDVVVALDETAVDLIEKRELIPGGRADMEITKTGVVIYEK